MRKNWKKVLTSRKFWASVAAFVALLVPLLGGTEKIAARITSLIMTGATVVACLMEEEPAGTADTAAGEKRGRIPRPTGDRGRRTAGVFAHHPAHRGDGRGK